MSWDDLTDREKDLDRKITASVNYDLIENNIACYSEIFNLNEYTVDHFMTVTGADPTERDFIISRLKARIRAYEAMIQTDKFIETTEYMLEKFKESDDKFIEKGKELGIDFQ